MTDNEIINDFEKEIKYVRENEKYDDFNPIVDIDLCEDILDLINRQKAEIERLNEKITAKDESNYYLMGQLRLEKEKRLTAKSEAMKEFAERLKKEALKHKIFPLDSCVGFDDIDNLEKEMMEVETNQRKEDEGNETDEMRRLCIL